MAAAVNVQIDTDQVSRVMGQAVAARTAILAKFSHAHGQVAAPTLHAMLSDVDPATGCNGADAILAELFSQCAFTDGDPADYADAASRVGNVLREVIVDGRRGPTPGTRLYALLPPTRRVDFNPSSTDHRAPHTTADTLLAIADVARVCDVFGAREAWTEAQAAHTISRRAQAADEQVEREHRGAVDAAANEAFLSTGPGTAAVAPPPAIPPRERIEGLTCERMGATGETYATAVHAVALERPDLVDELLGRARPSPPVGVTRFRCER
jgi:hypothetical protein